MLAMCFIVRVAKITKYLLLLQSARNRSDFPDIMNKRVHKTRSVRN